MRFRFAFLPASLVVVLALTAYLGCKKDNAADNAAKPEEQQAAAKAAVEQFLTAVQTGDDETASGLLTTKARTEMQKAEMYVQPPGSPNAKFTIGQVELKPELNGAHVDSQWTDVDEFGERNTYDITWIMKQEDDAWRVAGMAIPQFIPDYPSLVLNFENPADMQSQVAAAEAEVARRNANSGGQIQQAARPPEQTGQQQPRY